METETSIAPGSAKIGTLTRLGHLLVDLSTVCGVVPVFSIGDFETVFGFNVVTTGGTLEVRDPKTIEAVHARFYRS